MTIILLILSLPVVLFFTGLYPLYRFGLFKKLCVSMWHHSKKESRNNGFALIPGYRFPLTIFSVVLAVMLFGLAQIMTIFCTTGLHTLRKTIQDDYTTTRHAWLIQGPA